MRKPSTLDALIGYFTPSHVIHQRLLLQFLSAPEDGRKTRPKHVEQYCSYKYTYCQAASRWFFLYILTYDARKTKHKMYIGLCYVSEQIVLLIIGHHDQKGRLLTLNLLTTTIVAPPSNVSKWQIGFNSGFKGLRG